MGFFLGGAPGGGHTHFFSPVLSHHIFQQTNKKMEKVTSESFPEYIVKYIVCFVVVIFGGVAQWPPGL